MLYSKKEYQSREQDAPTAVPRNKHCQRMHDHYNATLPNIDLHSLRCL
ncbi:hypothetical protein [Okeania sp. SIO1I7]|nr:hypothetical protein [Okeania sp. SIO1I7]NET26191.1 hypothetical protein [Okeania sp. SIO1I7]